MDATRLYWDNLNEGQVCWGDRLVAERQEMLAYARRNDPLPFHIDEEAAKTSMFGTLIASGRYTVTLWYRASIPVIAQLAFLGGAEWHIKLTAPVKPGDKLRLKIEVASRRTSSKPDRGYVTVKQTLLNEDEIVVFTNDFTWIIARRPE